MKVSPLPVTDWHSLCGWFQSPQRKKFRASAVGQRMASLVVWWQAIQYTMRYLHMVFSFEALGWIWSWADLVRASVEEMVCLYFFGGVEWSVLRRDGLFFEDGLLMMDSPKHLRRLAAQRTGDC